MSKRGLFLGALLVICLVVGIFWALQTRTPSTSQAPFPSVLPSLLPAKTVVNQPTYDTSRITAAFPKTVQKYNLKQAFNYEVEAFRIAAALGFSSPPSSEQTIRGFFYTWEAPKGRLVIGGNPLEVSYATSNKSGAVAITDPPGVFAQMAQAFILQLGLLPVDGGLSSPEYNYLHSVADSVDASKATPGQANLITVRFNLLLNNLPLFTSSPQQSAFSFQYNSQRQLMTFFGRIYPNLEKTGSEQISLLPLSGGVSRLQNNEGTLLFAEAVQSSIEYEQIKRYVLPSVQVTKTDLAYYYNSGMNVLIPLYVFTGQGNDATGDTIEIRTGLYALP